MKLFTFSHVPPNLTAEELSQYQRKELELFVKFQQETITRLEQDLSALTVRVQALEQNESS